MESSEGSQEVTHAYGAGASTPDGVKPQQQQYYAVRVPPPKHPHRDAFSAETGPSKRSPSDGFASPGRATYDSSDLMRSTSEPMLANRMRRRRRGSLLLQSLRSNPHHASSPRRRVGRLGSLRSSHTVRSLGVKNMAHVQWMDPDPILYRITEVYPLTAFEPMGVPSDLLFLARRFRVVRRNEAFSTLGDAVTPLDRCVGNILCSLAAAREGKAYCQSLRDMYTHRVEQSNGALSDALRAFLTNVAGEDSTLVRLLKACTRCMHKPVVEALHANLSQWMSLEEVATGWSVQVLFKQNSVKVVHTLLERVCEPDHFDWTWDVSFVLDDETLELQSIHVAPVNVNASTQRKVDDIRRLLLRAVSFQPSGDVVDEPTGGAALRDDRRIPLRRQ